MENKDKRILIMVIVLVIMFAVFGSTLAYFSWVSSEEQQTMVTFTAESDFSCSADGGGNITSSDVMLAPSTCTNGEYAIQREVKVMPTINSVGKTVYMDLWLDVNVLETGLSESENFMYALTTDENSCSTGIVSTGNFNSLATGDKVNLFEGKEYTTTTNDIYYLYIWLDAAETSSDTMDQDFDLSLGGSCTDKTIYKDPVLNGADPELDDGMIPVVISDDGTVTTVSDSDSSWYNYTNKQWANAVLVKENGTQTRSYYQENLSNNVTVSQDDILAYYVWIPRYKYKIWTTEQSSAGSEQPIDIVFQDVNDQVATGTEVGEYLTHPAFDFGEEKLSGIWVGKFETTQGTTENVGTSNPTILPNINSWNGETVSTQFQTSLVFAGGTLIDGVVSFAGSSTYGLSSNVDSHMIKSRDWGAIVYLSHSIYGINKEITLNINEVTTYTHITGCGYTSGSTSNCNNAYGDYSEYPQSTTGNISGIFDIAGGSYDGVMGVLADDDGNPQCGAASGDIGSGFNGTTYYFGTSYNSSGIDFPPDKYYDLYTSDDIMTACNGGICYGHSLSETYGWYEASTNFIKNGVSWLKYGGVGGGETSEGKEFNFSNSGGGSGTTEIATRSILTIAK